MLSKSRLLALSFLLFQSNAIAQQEDSTSLSKEKALAPVEIKALRATSDAPFSKTELSGNDLQKQNLGQDMPYLLQFTTSAVTTSDAGTGVGYTGLRVRGTDGTRINVTLNGIPVNDAESQGAFFVDLPDLASSTSSIQLQRGVGTSTNGGGAFGATMSVSNLEQMQTAGAEANMNAGSFNTQKYTIKTGTGLLDHGLQFDLRLSKISSDGYIQRSTSDLRSLQFLAGWQVNNKTSLRFMLLTGKEKTGQAWNGVPEDSLSTNRTYNELGKKADGSFYNNQTDNYQQDYYQLFFNHKFNPDLTANIALFLTKGKGYYEEYRLGEAFDDYGLPDFISGIDTLSSTDMIRQLWLDNDYYGSVFSLLYEKNKTQISFGGAYTQYDGMHYGFVKWAQYGVPADHQWYDLTSRKNDLNFYAKAEQAIGKLLLFADLQWRMVDYEINGFRKNPSLYPTVDYNFFNPKLGITYKLHNAADNRQQFYASFAVANKEPGRDDFEASPISMPRSEQLYDLEAGYRMQKMKWSAALNFYYMKYKDQLVLTGKINDVGAYTRSNVSESFRQGIEIEAGTKPFYWLEIQANATFSQNQIIDFTEYIDNYDDNTQQLIQHGNTDIAFSPKTIASAIISFKPFRKHRFGFDILNKYVGAQFLDNTSNEDRRLKAFLLNDIRLRYSIARKPFRELTAILAFNNVFNKTYESNGYTFSYIYGNSLTTSNYYYPQAGFNLLFGLGLKF